MSKTQNPALVHFHGRPTLAKKFKFPGSSGSRNRNGRWEFGALPSGYRFPYKNWFVSEKYDGVRILWDGVNFKSRGGHVYHAPEWFKKHFPRSTGLDGELFAGNDSFQFVTGAARRKVPNDADWKKMKFLAFDILHGECMDRPYKVRYAWLKKIVKEAKKRGNKHLELVVQHPITSLDMLYRFYQKVLRQGGEGVVLRNPNSIYEEKRSDNLLKWKPVPEQEALVVGYNEGQGKYKGKLGTFRVALIDDQTKKVDRKKQFNLSGKMSDEFRGQYKFSSKGKLVKQPSKSSHFPRIGDRVTFEFMSWTKGGLPRQPIFVRVRRD